MVYICVVALSLACARRWCLAWVDMLWVEAALAYVFVVTNPGGGMVATNGECAVRMLTFAG